jgi:hypothetical protein
MTDALTENDYSKFHRRIENYVAEIEAHLRLPAGTVGLLGTSKDSDFVFVMKVHGVIEPLLKEAVRESIRRAIEHPKTATSGSEALMKVIDGLRLDRLRTILFEFGAIDETDSSFIDALFTIRNHYAHHIANSVLSVREVCAKMPGQDGDRQLLRKLIGLNDLSDDIIEHVRSFIFYHTIFFLQKALHMAKPPPPLFELLGHPLSIAAADTPLAARVTSQPPTSEFQEK